MDSALSVGALKEMAREEIEGLIELLGWKPGTTYQSRALWIRTDGLYQKTIPERQVIFSMFAAFHLVRLVHAFLDSRSAVVNDGLHNTINGHVALLAAIHENCPYIAKYMQSEHPDTAASKLLVPFYADLLATAIDGDTVLSRLEAADTYKSEVQILMSNCSNACSLLSSLIAFDKPDRAKSIPASVKRRLLVPLRTWSAQFRPGSISQTVEHFLAVFYELVGALEDDPRVTKRMDVWCDTAEGVTCTKAGLRTCRVTGCEVTVGLYQCANCKTAVYCGRKHQREDWHSEFPHQALCYKTRW